MAELLQNWLNNEIELSKPVQNFEKDFANGYLFGELLYKFNQQSNFKEFSKKENVASKIDNFNKLQPTLKNLKVKFDSKVIDSIMKEERGVSLRILYQLKMALEKVYPPTDIAVLRKTGKMGDNQPALKIAHSKEAYDQHGQKFFQQRLQVLNKPQKALNMEKHLSKFEEEKNRQEESAQKALKEEVDSKDRMKQEIRRAQINKLQRNAGFMEEWLQKGVEDWKKNQTIKKDRERKQLEFEYLQTQKYHDFAVTKIQDSTQEVLDGIAQFENTLRKQGIDPKVRKDDAERAVSESLQNSPIGKGRSQRFSSVNQKSSIVLQATMNATVNLQNSQAITLTSTGLKTKDKKTVTEKTRKERERRRRKMIVDQAKTHVEMEQKRRESQIVDRMKRQAKQEEELLYEQWRTNQCKSVIIENRKLREARYDRRRELDQQSSNMREEEMLRSMKEQMQRELQTFLNRDQEMRIVGKQAKRERRNAFGQNLFDAIFDIANEAYIHQQKSDTDTIDQRNWHEWLQLFVEELPIAGTLSSCAQKKPQVGFEEEQQQEEIEEGVFITQDSGPDANDKLDNIELFDYLKNQGQWTTNLITENQPNLEHFLTGQTDAQPAAGAKGAKGAPAKQAQEQIQLEEGDTELPLQTPNNFYLGDAVEQIINLNFEERMKQKRPKMPQYLNLKVCFIGYAFAGKKTQAQRFKEEYGLDLLYLNDLVQEAVKHYEEGSPEEATMYYSQQDYENEEVSEESELEGEYPWASYYWNCGQKIKDLLAEGAEITDDIYVDLVLAKLRKTYSHKTKRQIRYELRKKVEREREILKKMEPLQRELEEIQQQLQNDEMPGRRRRGQRSPAEINAQLDKLQEELDNSRKVEKNGWILVDFPSTFAQAKLLESILSGHVPLQECDPIDREKQVEDAFLLVQPTAKEEPPRTLIKSGLDAVIWFDVNREEAIRRAIGRRYDGVNEKMYHIEDVPPITTSNYNLLQLQILDAPLCERLTPMNEEDNAEGTLIDRWISFDQHAKGLENWLLKFGDPATNESILWRINAESKQDDTFQQVHEIFTTILLKKQQKEDEIRQKLNEKYDQMEQEEAERQRLLLEEEEERKRREEEGILEQEQPPKKEENKVQKPEPATERVPLKPPQVDNIDDDFKPTIIKVWQELSINYKAQMKRVFRQVRTQRERIIENFSHIQNNYLKYLHRPDIKQEKLDQFIRDFNDFSDQYPDLREDDQTKDELHQRCDILSDELWEIIEERKEQHIEERKKIMENGWIEHELGFMVTSAQQLMQSEVDKFKQCIQIIHDYYHTFEDKLIPEAPTLVTTEIVGENEELPAVETLQEGSDPTNPNSYNYPRLDKIFEKALKTQVVPDVTQVQASANDKKGPPAKGGAKDPKKQVEEEKPQEESQYVKDMKAAIKIEKSILRFRLTQIRNWALKRMREMRSKAIKVYSKLEDWIHVSNRAENSAVDEMCIVIKRAIEEEKKIQDELRIKFMDFCVDEKIMNYIDPPPEKLPAMEEVRYDRFNIEQLRTLVKELQDLAKQHGNGTPNIPDKVVVDLFVRKLENSRTLGDEGSLPEEWRNLSEYTFQNMIRNLDKYNTGVINWKLLATYIILLKSSIPTDKNIENYKQELEKAGCKGDNFNLDKFINVNNSFQLVQVHTWFDECEYSRDRDYSIPFPRVKYIKELLYSVNKDNNSNRLNIEKFMKLLKAKELTMFKRNLKTFEDILMASNDKEK